MLPSVCLVRLWRALQSEDAIGMWLCENSQVLVFFSTPPLFLFLSACLLFKTRPFPQEAAVTRHAEVILSCSSHGVQLVLHVGLPLLNVQQ